MKKSKNNLKPIANFLFEAGILSKTPRSGFHFLGAGKQNVAEHINRMTFIGYTMASLLKNVNREKVVLMCLFHDLPETRVSDLNYVHQMYVMKNEARAVDDLTATLPFGQEMKAIIQEYEAKKSKESMIVHDADQLELLLSLREITDTGNSRPKAWMASALKRLKTPLGKKLGQVIVTTDSSAWWFGNTRRDEWWVSRNKKKSKISWNKSK